MTYQEVPNANDKIKQKIQSVASALNYDICSCNQYHKYLPIVCVCWNGLICKYLVFILWHRSFIHTLILWHLSFIHMFTAFGPAMKLTGIGHDVSRFPYEVTGAFGLSVGLLDLRQ